MSKMQNGLESGLANELGKLTPNVSLSQLPTPKQYQVVTVNKPLNTVAKFA